MLKTKRNHLLITLISLIGIIFGSYFLFSDGLPQEAIRSYKALWNLGHVAYFAFLTHIFLKLPILKGISYFKLSLLVITLAILIGIVIEFIQYGTARSADLFDVAHDVLGSLILLALHRPKLINTNNITFHIFRSLVFLLCIISLFPLLSALLDESHARSQFPILTNFSSKAEMHRWGGSAQFGYAAKVDNKTGGMRIVFNTDTYSGVHLDYFENNWGGYNKLVLEFFNPEKEALAIVLKIYDLQHKPNYIFSDRLNLTLRLKHGWNKIELPIEAIKKAPKSRLMDLNNIDTIAIFTVRLQRPRSLFVKSIYLSH